MVIFSATFVFLNGHFFHVLSTPKALDIIWCIPRSDHFPEIAAEVRHFPLPFPLLSSPSFSRPARVLSQGSARAFLGLSKPGMVFGLGEEDPREDGESVSSTEPQLVWSRPTSSMSACLESVKKGGKSNERERRACVSG